MHTTRAVMDETSIDIPGYDKPLPFVSRDSADYLRRTTVLYGASDSGKTVVVKWILNKLKDIIPCGIVITPTGSANNSFADIVPRRCIKINPAVSDLRIILEKQKNATIIYNKVNCLATLKKICDRVNDLTCISTCRRIHLGTTRIIENINANDTLNFAQKREQVKNIEERLTSMLRRLYKKTIQQHRELIVCTHTLDVDERYAIKYINFNPHFLLLMDDCASQIDKWAKDDAINQIFFEGRHYFITTIITMQDDKKLNTGIRKNTFTNVFTEANCSIGFFQNKANGFTTQIKKDGDRISNHLFAPNANGTNNYKKLIYARRDNQYPFRYIIADDMGDFRIFSPSLWKLCEEIPDDEDAGLIKESSAFYTSFKV